MSNNSIFKEVTELKFNPEVLSTGTFVVLNGYSHENEAEYKNCPGIVNWTHLDTITFYLPLQGKVEMLLSEFQPDGEEPASMTLQVVPNPFNNWNEVMG